jgi:carbon-monoxide dehydrogenase medium subunit
VSLPQFAYHQPEGFEELFDLSARYGEEARYFSGGTALMLLMRAELLQPSALISLARLPLRGVTREDGVIRIGALTTHTELARSELLRRELPMLADTFAHVATRRIRNVGTVGGNLAHANPHQDPPVSLTALGASVLVRGPRGERRIALDSLFIGYFETSLEPGEVLTAIEVPVPTGGTRATFVKYLPRSADDYATVNVAVVFQSDGERIRNPRIVVGSMGPTPLRAREAERLLDGHPLDDARVREAAQLAISGAEPEHDSRGSPEYKRKVAPVIVSRAIRQAWQSPSAHLAS